MNIKKPFLFIVYFAFWLIFHSIIIVDSSVAEKNNASNAPVDILFSIDEVNQKIGEIDNNIKTITAVQSEQVAEEFGVDVADIEKRLLDLRALKSSYERLLISLKALNKIEKEKIAITEEYENYRNKGMAKRPPYTLSFLDSIQEELSTAERYQNNIDLTIEMLRQEVADHMETIETIEKELRNNEERQERAEGDNIKLFRWIVDEKKINLEHLKIMIQAKKNEIKRYELEKDYTAVRIALYKEQTSFVKSNVKYDDEDLKYQLEAIRQKKENIQNEIKKLRSEQKSIEKEWVKAQQGVERARQNDKRAIAEAYLNSRNEWRKTYQVMLELKEKGILLLDRQINAWQERYALLKGDLSSDQLKNLKKEVEKDLSSLSQTLKIQQNYLTNLQKQLGTIESRIAEEGIPEPIREHLLAQLKALRKQLDRRLEYQSVILSVDRVEKRLLSEIENKMGQITIKEHLTDFKKDIIDFWNIEILTVDNKPVTLRKVAIALVILIVGIITAKFLLTMVRNRFLIKSQLKETTASAVHKILSYSAYLLVGLLALRMVNIPLTAFAFLGGAVAIGIGFGAQNLINNFISGFMILGERPINIGDLIEVDGVLGMVEEIGARCTRVRTGENIHILVPNSSFLEKNITNWTLSDKKIRANIVVGVAYGSPVRKVEELLIQAVNQVPRVLRRPDPFVLFDEFGDNALIFHVYFWVAIQRVIERRQIESDMRFKIDELFNKEGIVIAFPQRDVHIDTDRPIKISLTETANEHESFVKE